jgi:hypothetical protein
VHEQWNTGELSVLKYAKEYMDHGDSVGNKYEDAANEFARNNEAELKRCMGGICEDGFE